MPLELNTPNNIESVLARCKRNENGCLEWKGMTFWNGYAKVSYHGKTQTGHRLVWKLLKGDPGKLHVCHKCDNRICLNVDHYFLGTRFDNMQDARRKGKYATQNKSHCKRGHSWADAYVYKSGPRKGKKSCRHCRKFTLSEWRGK